MDKEVDYRPIEKLRRMLYPTESANDSLPLFFYSARRSVLGGKKVCGRCGFSQRKDERETREFFWARVLILRPKWLHDTVVICDYCMSTEEREWVVEWVQPPQD